MQISNLDQFGVSANTYTEQDALDHIRAREHAQRGTVAREAAAN